MQACAELQVCEANLEPAKNFMLTLIWPKILWSRQYSPDIPLHLST